MTGSGTPERILVTRMKFIGDVVLTTPVIRSLRAAFPDAFIAYMGDAGGVSLLRENPFLDKIIPYDIEWVLPGHRTVFRNHRHRIEELKKHHEIRTAEVASILDKGSQTAYQVASQMAWDIDCESWDDFPLPQKWFAGGEAMAHLQYLQGQGKVVRELNGGKAFFRLAG